MNVMQHKNLKIWLFNVAKKILNLSQVQQDFQDVLLSMIL